MLVETFINYSIVRIIKMIERYVVGMNQSDFNALDDEAERNSELERLLDRLRDNSKWSDGVLLVEYELSPNGVTGAWGSLERAKLLMPHVAREYKLPVDKFRIYKETVSVELVE